jgi:signal peptidase I
VPDPPTGVRRARQLPFWQEAILLVVTAVLMAVVLKAFLVQAFYIPSGSMEPTMLVDDKILVQKVSYWGGDVHRGDVVVFDDPGGWLGPGDTPPGSPVQTALSTIGLAPTGGHLIKRVIGTGGDHVMCCAAGRLQVNGVPVDEPYVLDRAATAATPFDVTVPAGRLWVMGDNRGNSYASPQHLDDPDHGFVAESGVVGRAWVRLWPLGRAGFVRGTSAFDEVPAP